jgi:hypothetical protein
MMSYKLFIDDERFPVDDSFVVVRSSNEAISCMKVHGCPCFISFDHDLGEEDTSMAVVHRMIYKDLGGPWLAKDFTFYVHSQNPIGKKNIEGLLNNYLSFEGAYEHHIQAEA